MESKYAFTARAIAEQRYVVGESVLLHGFATHEVWSLATALNKLREFKNGIIVYSGGKTMSQIGKPVILEGDLDPETRIPYASNNANVIKEALESHPFPITMMLVVPQKTSQIRTAHGWFHFEHDPDPGFVYHDDISIVFLIDYSLPNAKTLASCVETLLTEDELTKMNACYSFPPKDWKYLARPLNQLCAERRGVFLSGVLPVEAWQIMETLEEVRGDGALGGSICFAAHLSAKEMGKPSGEADPETGNEGTWRSTVPLVTSCKKFLERALRIHHHELNACFIIPQSVKDIIKAHFVVERAKSERPNVPHIVLVVLADPSQINHKLRKQMRHVMALLYTRDSFVAYNITCTPV